MTSPQQAQLTKARLIHIDKMGKSLGHNIEVQFNPETLKVSYANQVEAPKESGDKSNAAAQQFVGKGSTKLSVQLWFDVTGTLSAAQRQTAQGDVRKLTKGVIYFIEPQKGEGENKEKLLPPRVRFLWGSFMFDGIVEGIEESLEFFSPEGRPLRASVSLNLIQQEFQFQFGEAAGTSPGRPGGSGPAGATPMTPAPAGSSVQSLADAQGKGSQWKGIAAANGIENPRVLPVGQLINLNVKLPEVSDARRYP